MIAKELAHTAVKTASGGSINAGIWTLVGIAVTTIGTTIGLIAVAYIKQWGPWKRIDSENRAADFKRLREDIDKQNDRIMTLEQLVADANRVATAANEHAMRSDAKLQTALTACEVLLTLVEREMPEAKEINLVKRLLAQAASEDLGIGKAMRELAMMKGTNE